jgi:hypothetical protein
MKAFERYDLRCGEEGEVFITLAQPRDEGIDSKLKRESAKTTNFNLKPSTTLVF